ncbi:Hypothetical protein DEACI_2013 [Acididesulfobacillus acetoxydans]|uniref:Uncharacterized protein n=1 Tax=Acididesulfobacillus acetoxydans TaxID=1561005 RepID=A0A8S0XWY1_9FIRM|nr:Hypothetical protein DEACI_2013 [Acididesulfobacillus acetoxydans]CEJ07174.1 Hypothetical protein DEACI_1632 [Acididesulfobacillus acetoxydans]
MKIITKIVPLMKRNSPLALIQLLRPWQWAKNLFVFLGFLFSQDWGNSSLLLRVVELAVAFSLTSSSVYILTLIPGKNYTYRTFDFI